MPGSKHWRQMNRSHFQNVCVPCIPRMTGYYT